MSHLDRLFIARALAHDAPQARPRAVIPAAARGNLRDNQLRYCGYTRPAQDAIPYPIALHNPYLVEHLLERNVRILDSLLALRTQYMDYQKLAEDASGNAILFEDFSRLEEEQEGYLASAEGTAATLLSAQKTTQSAEGGLTSPTSESQTWANARDEALRQFARKRRERLKAHEAELARRRNDPADGSNFAARQRRVEDRYWELLQDAAFRSWAISDGCRMCYGKDLNPPQPSEEFLDELVKWHKVVLDEVEKILRRDIEHTVQLSFRFLLTDGRHVESNAAGNTYLASGWDATRAKLSGDTIRFRLPTDVFFPEQDFVRLRGFGFVISGDKNAALGTWSVRVTPPIASVGDGATTTPLGLAPVFAGGVRESLANDLTLHGSKYFNCDPCAGEWEVRVMGASTLGKLHTEIINVELSLLVATLPRIA